MSGSGFFDIPSDLQHSYLGLVGLHVQEAMIPVGLGLAVALPLGQLCVRFRWIYPPLLWVTTVLYAIPSLAFFVFLIDYTGATRTTVMIPLTVYTLVILIPAIVDGVRSVPEETMSAATAMGLGPVQRYLKVQLPLAVPAIFAGLRVATASSISLVSVGAIIGNQGALGNLLQDAILYHRSNLALNSVLSIAVLSVVADVLLVLLRTALTPWLPRGGRAARAASAGAPEPAAGAARVEAAS
ncbi:ABC transporter permease [Streptomyces sp. NPDC020983]|uniref:ABC transporter permease n=1 Tax=Streptomyces sp. NPDC020983 TaxID=3365106 RepID=UPI0037BC3A06